MKKVFVLVFILCCSKGYSQNVQNGMWRGVLHLTNVNLDLPFNFEVKDTEGKKVLDVINWTERIRVDEISNEGDSVFIHMPVFQSEFRLRNEGDSLIGMFYNYARKTQNRIPFVAYHNVSYRFPVTQQIPSFDFTGKWEAHFSPGTSDSSDAIGIFTQTGNQIAGTFRTPTGDDRFLQGVVNGKEMELSAFDGSHLFLFHASAQPDGSIKGNYYSGMHWNEPWTAKKNDGYHLPDENSLTYLKPGYTKFDFHFPDLDSNLVSLSDARFRNKVVIVEITGSWCPNCMDESRYLAPFYKEYKNKDVEIVGLSFEKTTDFRQAVTNVTRLKNHFDIQYPLLIAGTYGPDAAKSLPQLNKIAAYPTTIFIDKKGNVRAIHTGFDGPATGIYYEHWKDEFNGLVDKLLAE